MTVEQVVASREGQSAVYLIAFVLLAIAGVVLVFHTAPAHPMPAAYPSPPCVCSCSFVAPPPVVITPEPPRQQLVAPWRLLAVL